MQLVREKIKHSLVAVDAAAIEAAALVFCPRNKR
jgi:hypothetical protein